LRDPLIELIGETLLLAAEPCLLQSDRRLIRCCVQKKAFGLTREIHALRTGHDHADFTVRAQWQGNEND
jgi:hypothetical protein